MPDANPEPAKSPSGPQVAKTAEPSGSKADNPSTAGPGPTAVHSNTPENSTGKINPSAPEDVNATPGTLSPKDGKGTIE